MKLFLASQSPRRRELMKLAGFDFEILIPQTDEFIESQWKKNDVAEILATKKAEAVFTKFNLNNDSVIVCADTIVLFEDKIFGKPKDEAEAFFMLKTLSGKQHEVITGVCIKSKSQEISFSDTSKVFFRNLEDDELNFYIRHHHPFDKAGSYGIQDWIGVRIVERVEGDYFNVMGLPVRIVCDALKNSVSGLLKTEGAAPYSLLWHLHSPKIFSKMSNALFKVPTAVNEPVLNYASGSSEKIALKNAIKKFKSETAEYPMVIGGKNISTGNMVDMRPPHEHKHLLGKFHKGEATHVTDAIATALKAKHDWENMNWESRAAIFLKAADLLAGPYRARINAATMLGQSKNAYQAEIDSACELIDFLRFNAQFMTEIYAQQPQSSKGMWNRTEHRALEGFTFAITPFNFTAIAGNLPTSMAMMGNTVVWKPANTQVFSAWVIMEVLREAGLPDGVINLVYTPGPVTGDIIFSHSDFAGIHFTGSTEVFQGFWKTIGGNIAKYKTYPRIVGETGGKDFVMVHPSADAGVVATALSRGAFEYQGQKCSAASRAYIPSNLWKDVSEKLVADLRSMKMGSTEDFTNFINAVIDEKSFDKLAAYIDDAKKSSEVKIIAGGNYDKSEGYFIQPTVLQTTNPKYVTMCDELFGPVLTVFVYDETKFDETLEIVNSTSAYALTGSIISRDRSAIDHATVALRHAAGNFYINDKPTGAVVGQQPFGGSRASGTNDKAGSAINLLRWVSPRSIKETFTPPTDYRYPFLMES